MKTGKTARGMLCYALRTFPNLSFFFYVTRSGPNPNLLSYPVCTEDFNPGTQMARAWRWPSMTLSLPTLGIYGATPRPIPACRHMVLKLKRNFALNYTYTGKCIIRVLTFFYRHQVNLQALARCIGIIIIFFFLHWLGRLTCSGIDALSLFPRASTISSSSKFVVEGVFPKSGVLHSFKMIDPVLFVFDSHVLYSRYL